MQPKAPLSQSRIHALIVDNNALVRAGITAQIQKIDAKAEIAQAANAFEALRLINGNIHYDLIILDINMPDMDGLNLIKQIRSGTTAKETAIIVTSSVTDSKTIQNAKSLGVNSFLTKDASAEAIRQSIQSMLNELDPKKPRQTTVTNPTSSKKKLNKRQLQILQHLSQGMSNKEISQTIFLSEGTIKNHITQIFNYLGVSNRTQAIIEAEKLNLTGKS